MEKDPKIPRLEKCSEISMAVEENTGNTINNTKNRVDEKNHHQTT